MDSRENGTSVSNRTKIFGSQGCKNIYLLKICADSVIFYRLGNIRGSLVGNGGGGTKFSTLIL